MFVIGIVAMQHMVAYGPAADATSTQLAIMANTRTRMEEDAQGME